MGIPGVLEKAEAEKLKRTFHPRWLGGNKVAGIAAL